MKVEQHFEEIEQVIERKVIGDVTIETIFNPVDGERVVVSCEDPTKPAELIERIEEETGVKPIARRIAN